MEMFKETLWNRLYEYLGQQADNEGSEIHRYLADWRKDKKIKFATERVLKTRVIKSTLESITITAYSIDRAHLTVNRTARCKASPG